jgi:unsaturated pyranuronate lyase
MSETAHQPSADEGSSLGDAASHFSTVPGGTPVNVGRFVSVDAVAAAEFLPGLEFRPVLGHNAMANFVTYQPGATAPRHAHEEEQIVIVLEGEFTFDLDGDVRTMRKGDVAVVPSWVPHGGWTTDSHCLEVDVFAPPRSTLLRLAEAQAAESAADAEGIEAETDPAGEA